MLADADRRLIARIMEVAEKLLFETARLRGDVVRLHGRIEPFENEVKIRDLTPTIEKPKTLKDALALLARSRDNILECEHELTAIRGSLDNIAADAISREEMKPWLKSPPNREEL
ncbi:MAG: hypothetical protein AB7P12_16200 [Alphaproteobacteria bacterium]